MKKRSFLGIIFILLGLGFLLDQFGILSFSGLVSTYWPIVLILIGLFGLFKRGTSKTINGLVLLFGLLFQARNLGWIDVNMFKVFWPVILIIIGFNILFSKDKVVVKGNFTYDSKNNKGFKNNVSLDDYIEESVLLTGLEKSIQSQNLKGGKISSTLAGVELDLRGAKLYKGEATLDIDVVLGGVELYLPENWRVEYKGSPTLGGIDIRKRDKLEPDSPVLKINYSILMGGIDIK